MVHRFSLHLLPPPLRSFGAPVQYHVRNHEVILRGATTPHNTTARQLTVAVHLQHKELSPRLFATAPRICGAEHANYECPWNILSETSVNTYVYDG
jgi:hypothetical protein